MTDFPKTLRLKLEIPRSNDILHDYHELHRTTLTQVFEENGYYITSDYPLQLDVPGCSSFLEYNYEVYPESVEQLITVMHRFYRRLKAEKVPPESMGTIKVHQMDWFSQEIKTDHLEEPLRAINFGNIQDGTFLDHWEVSYDEETENGQLAARITVDFEYDRTDMIVVQFDNKVNERKDKNRKEIRKGVRKYSVQIQRNDIRRIVVDPDVAIDESGMPNKFRIYLELNSPPVIKEVFEKEGDKYTSKKERKTIMKRGTKQIKKSENGMVELVAQTPKDAAISDSPFFSMEFYHDVEERRIYEVVSRLRARTDAAVEFLSIPISEPKEKINGYRIGQTNPYARWLCKGAHPYDIEPATLLRQPRDDLSEEDAALCTRQNLGQTPRYPSPLDEREPTYAAFLNKHFPIENIALAEESPNFHNRFVIQYLIECLISRGAIVKDQLWLEESKWTSFLDLISDRISHCFDTCEMALERLITMIDERKRVGSLHRAFREIYDIVGRDRINSPLSEQQIKEGYQRVRKLILTPTRVIYMVPEILMSNRVLREYDEKGNRILRVIFRDDDGNRMSESKTSVDIIERTVKKHLLDGITVAGRCYAYLGSSNSQLRDCGAYVMVKVLEEQVREYFRENKKAKSIPPDYRKSIHIVRSQLGKFMEMKSVSKMMARLGQCFTQTREVKVELNCYSTKMDVIGGSDSNGSEYTFSDGVGTVSEKFMKEIAKVLGFRKGHPSCIQFRYRGLKGVLSVDPTMDEFRDYANKFEFERWDPVNKKMNSSSKKAGAWDVQCTFRNSQQKFHGAKQEFIEIVKFSTPVPVSFNKPFLNIMDQVSEKQSLECHRRVVNRIEELLDNQLRGYAKMMIDENSCRNRLKEMAARINVDVLSVAAGFSLTSEPFFRSLVKASVKFAITKQLMKQQINIPHHLGRCMLGVVDETGLLQSGQVFVQYTVNIGNKMPTKNAAKKVLNGTVLITKNPCIVEGDVRIYQAVDLPELRHLTDIVVFPQHGPRPHPDEMAGSDLDGDEYSVIWDSQLFFSHNMPAFDFTAEKQQEVTLTEETMDAEMVKFYTKYVTQDSVGTIATNHICQSDLYGISAKVCQNLAKKYSQALDFTKSGNPPLPLTKAWSADENGESIPPEKSERFPDFHVTDNVKPVYESHRLIGRVHREIRVVEDVVRLSEDLDEQVDIKLDELITCDGWEQFTGTANEQLSRYNAILRNLMENYGIKTEAEIFSGCICDMRNKISEKEQSDPRSTNQILENRISELFAEFRAEFFEEFGGWQDCTEVVDRFFADETNVCQRRCTNVTVDMAKKAVAYYRLCYQRAQQTHERFLSFAWLVYDIIYEVKKSNVMLDPNFFIGPIPLHKMLEEHNWQYIEENCEEAQKLFEFESEKFGNATEVLRKYSKKYKGIERVFFLLCEWATNCQLLTGPLSERHICLIFVLHVIGRLVPNDEDQEEETEETEEDDESPSSIKLISPKIPLSEVEQGFSFHITQPEVLLRFFGFLGSRSFNKLKCISFIPLGYQSILKRGEWQILHTCALKTYHNLVFNLRFEELPLSTDVNLRTSLIAREAEPFAIELPSGILFIDEIARVMKEKTGVQNVVMRQQQGFRQLKGENKRRKEKYSVMAKGTIEAMDRLRNLLAVRARNHSIKQAREMSELMPQMTFYQIMGYYYEPPAEADADAEA